MATILNARAWDLVDSTIENSSDLRINVEELDCGTRLLDFGVNTEGSLEAGLLLARICTSDMAHVSLQSGMIGDLTWPMVQVTTDMPVMACLYSQYAGWEVKKDKYFAMASGPMRANAGREDLFRRLGYTEKFYCSVGVLETSKLPNSEIVREIALRAQVEPRNLVLIAAAPSSIAGSLQINARSVETGLHKLYELGFDVHRIRSATGIAPLSPVAADPLTAIGRTNDAILYGGRLTFFVTGDDESIAEVGRQVPSSASSDAGRPFAEIFESVGHDFYKVDPMLFSPAQVVFQNIETGRVQWFGQTDDNLLRKSFGIAS